MDLVLVTIWAGDSPRAVEFLNFFKCALEHQAKVNVTWIEVATKCYGVLILWRRSDNSSLFWVLWEMHIFSGRVWMER